MYRRLFIVLTLLSIACAPDFRGKEVPSIVDGTMDLRAWDFEEDGPVKLDGTWLFAWERPVEPAPWGALRAEMPRLVEVPSRWVKTPVSVDEPDTMLPGVGYATYALRLRLPSNFRPSIRWKSQISASKLILLDADGEPLSVTQSGIPGVEPSKEVPQSHREFSLELPTSLTTSASAGLGHLLSMSSYFS